MLEVHPEKETIWECLNFLLHPLDYFIKCELLKKWTEEIQRKFKDQSKSHDDKLKQWIHVRFYIFSH